MGITSPVAGNRFRRAAFEGAFVPGPFMHARYRYAHARHISPGLIRFHPIEKESFIFRFLPNNNIMIFWYFTAVC